MAQHNDDVRTCTWWSAPGTDLNGRYASTAIGCSHQSERNDRMRRWQNV